MRKKTVLKKVLAILTAAVMLMPAAGAAAGAAAAAGAGAMAIDAGAAGAGISAFGAEAEGLSFTKDLPPQMQAAAGEPVAFSIEAEGAPNIRYQWYKDGEPIAGATGGEYTIPAAKAQDAGEYYAAATGEGPAPSATEVVNQNFDAIAAGTAYNTQWNELYPLSLSWADGANWAATVVPKGEGDNCLELKNTGESDSTELQVNAYQISADVIDFNVSLKGGDRPRGIDGNQWYDHNEQVYIRSQNNEIRICLFDGTLSNRDVGVNPLLSGLNDWFDLRIVANNVSRKFDLYVNGNIVIADAAYTQDNAIDGFFITGNYHGANYTGPTEPVRGLFYVDNFYVLKSDAPDVVSVESARCMLSVSEAAGGFMFATDLNANEFVNQNDRLALAVDAVNADYVAYDWYKDGKEIPRARAGADGKSFVINNAATGDSGAYQVKATSYSLPVAVAANQNFDSLAVGRKLQYQSSPTQPFCPSDLPPFGLSWTNASGIGATVVARDGADNCIEVSAEASMPDRPRLTADIAGDADAPGSKLDIRFSIRESSDDVFIRDIGNRTNANDEGACFRLRLSGGSLYNRDINPNAAIASGLTVGQWHDIRIVADNAEKKFDVYADGRAARAGVDYYSESGVAYGLMLEGEYASRLRRFYVDDVYITRTEGAALETIESAECNVIVLEGAITVDSVAADSPVYSGDIVNADVYGVNVNNTAAVKVAVFDASGAKVSGDISIDTTTDPGHVYALVGMPLNNGAYDEEATYYIRVSTDAGTTYPEDPSAAVIVYSEARRPDVSTTYYVAKTGNNNNDGTAGAPFQTIGKAVSVAQAGDTIIVSPGVYTETVSISKSGQEGKPITVTTEKASARDQFLENTDIIAKLELTDLNSTNFSQFGDDINNTVYPDAVIVKGDQYGFLITGSYIDVKGFFVTTNRRNVGPQANQTDSAIGITIDGSKVPGGSGTRTQVVHHVNVIDNVVYRCGQAGISCFGDDSDRVQTGAPFADSNNNGGCDYLVIKGNVAFQNSETSCWQGSGIGLMGFKRTDMDESKWHFIVEDNLCFDNSNKVEGKAIYDEWLRTGGASGTAATCPFGRQRGETDGNGIILDWVARSAAGKMLVRNNILAHNGGRGLCITASDYVCVVNNTIIDNSFSDTQMYNNAEFECSIANGHIIMANNIIASTRGDNANHTRFTGANNYMGYNLYVGGDVMNGGFGKAIGSVGELGFTDFGAFSGTGPELAGRTVDPACFGLADDSPAAGAGYGRETADATAKGWLSNEEFKAILPEADFFGEARAQMDIGAVAVASDLSDTTPRVIAASAFPEALAPAGGESAISLRGLYADGMAVTATAFIGGDELPLSAQTVFENGLASLTLSFPANDTVANIVYTIKFMLEGTDAYQERTAQVTVRTDVVLPPVTIYDKGFEDGMLARWLLSADTADLSGGGVKDVTDNGHDGVIVGSVAFTDAPYYADGENAAGAMRFEAAAGKPSYVGIPQAGADDLKLADVVTISAWIGIHAPLGEYTKPVWVGDAVNAPWGAYGFEFMSPDTGNHNIVFTTGAESSYGSAGKSEVWYDEAFEPGDWHLVTGVFSKSEMEYGADFDGEREDPRYCQMFYVDGVLIGAKFSELHIGHYEDLAGSDYLMGIGATHSGDGPVNCEIGDVRIYGVALSAKDVMDLYDAYSLSNPSIKPTLKGAAGIDNMAPKAGDALTATLSATNAGGELHYIWKADGEPVGGDGAVYEVARGDAGKAITVTISSPDFFGEAVSAPTAAVEFDGPLKTTVWIGADEKSDVAQPVEFVLSMSGENAVTVVLEFEIESAGTMTFAGLETLNGFTAMDAGGGAVKWSQSAGGAWKGEATFVFTSPGDSYGFASESPVDIAKFYFDVTETGTALMRLTWLGVYGPEAAGGEIMELDGEIGTAEAQTSVIIVYSIYDLNKDGAVDALDLSIVALYCQFMESDAGWDTFVKTVDSFGDGVTASMCDFNGDGTVDMLDLVELYLNYTK